MFRGLKSLFQSDDVIYSELDKPLLSDANMGGNFTKTAADGLGFITNAPSDVDFEQIPRITTSLFGTISLQYPNGLGVSDLGFGTKKEKIQRAKEIALQDNYGYGSYWIDELTTFGCADPSASNYDSNIEYHVGDWVCLYPCQDVGRATDYLGNCQNYCLAGFEMLNGVCEEIVEEEEEEELAPASKPKTKVTQEQTWFEKNKNTIIVLSVVGVGVIALKGRGKK